uniref:NBS-LRR disease resistance protein n=1 Tax=Dasypyrum villosum TaxID=40247 RepID=A0A8K1MFY7_9POAL|nr:NBS-LRR disease resistance protein [Dasypyrum villosum]
MDTAIGAAKWVLGKALGPVTDGLLESWAASVELDRNIDALKMELLYAHGMLENAQGREIHGIALKELLRKLQQLAYGADDVLDELEYFRIQDALKGTYHATDMNAVGSVQGLRINQGCLSGVRLCGRQSIGSSPPTPANKGVKKVDGKCMPKVISTARNAAHTFGKHFPCYSRISVHDDDPQPIISECASQRDGDIETPELMFDRVQMSKTMMDMVGQLKEVCAKVSIILNLDLLGSSRTHTKEIAKNRSKTTSEVIEPELLYGRDDQKKKIVDGIISREYCPNQLHVLPIFGLGASIWICVSLDFNADRLAQEIVKKIDKVDGEKNNASAEELIQQRLKAKRFLLVLDDVWTYQEDEWNKLIAPFKKVESKGNLIVVTTRIPKVAEMISTTNPKIELGRLDDADTMRFFEACIFGNKQQPWEEHPELSETGRKVVDHLKGSPLATKTVGRLLRNQLTLDHWKKVLESKEWELQTSESDIMPALKLSYDFLPFHLKQLLLYCALFPEDYEFDSKELVQLWIGLGILHPSDWNKRIEDVGLDHLHELVSSYECVSISSCNVRSILISPYVRHLSIIVDDKDVNDRMAFDEYTKDLSALGKRLKVENLRTLMLFGHCHGSFAKTFASYSTEDILHSFSENIHLRYLRIKRSYWGHNIELPSMLFRFYHLEIINLEYWNDPISIRHITNLVKLRHFLVPKNMPQVHSDISEVGKLKLLSELRRFEVGKQTNGFELSQLAQLTELGGSLSIYNLEKVQEKGARGKEIRPIHTNHLRELTLEWDVKRSNRDPTREGNVLENLVPHSDLRDLCIRGHGGTSCPTWLGENLLVKNLESLHLADVSWKTLPPLGEFWWVGELRDACKCCISSPSFQKNCLEKKGFQNLKKLVFVKIPKLKKWAGNQTCGFFHLEVLIIEDCPELKELPFSCSTCSQQEQEGANMTLFPRLRELKIVRCPNLRTMPPIPWTSSLCVIEIEQAGSTFEKLTYSEGRYGKQGLGLEIRAAAGTDRLFWNEFAFYNLSALKILFLSNCPPLPFDIILMLTSLEELIIIGCSSIVLSPIIEGEGHAVYQVPVEELWICESGASGKELTQLLSHFPKLTSLLVSDCKNITELGVSEQQSGPQQQETKEEEEIVATAEGGLLLLPTQLQNLRLYDCRELRILPDSGDNNNKAAGGLQRLHSLRQVKAENCPNLLSSYSGSSSCFPFPTSLEQLKLANLEEHNLALTNLSNLEELELSYMEVLTNLMVSSSSKLHTLTINYSPRVLLSVSICTHLSTSLTKLIFLGSKEVEPIPGEALVLLTSLQELEFLSCDKLQFLPPGLHRLASMKTLNIDGCPSLQSLPKDGLPSSLLTLSISFCSMKSLPRDSLPSSLQQLGIYGCSEIEILPTFSDGFRTSLQKLGIMYCPAIKSVPKHALPSSLQELKIWACPGIKSLPEDGLPKSLRVLDVSADNSEELKRQCRRLKGTIPIIMAR